MTEHLPTLPPSPAKSLARVITALAHPGFLPLFMGLWDFPPAKVGWEPHLWAALFLAILPLLAILAYLWILQGDDIFTVQRKNRIIPFVLSIGLYLVYMAPWAEPLRLHHYSPVGLAYFVLLQGISLAVTFWWKISLHMIGVGALVAFAFHAGLPVTHPALFWGLLAGGIATAWARHFLQSHNWAQILAGFGVGFLVFFLWATLLPWLSPKVEPVPFIYFNF